MQVKRGLLLPANPTQKRTPVGCVFMLASLAGFERDLQTDGGAVRPRGHAHLCMAACVDSPSNRASQAARQANTKTHPSGVRFYVVYQL